MHGCLGVEVADGEYPPIAVDEARWHIASIDPAEETVAIGSHRTRLIVGVTILRVKQGQYRQRGSLGALSFARQSARLY